MCLIQIIPVFLPKCARHLGKKKTQLKVINMDKAFKGTVVNWALPS